MRGDASNGNNGGRGVDFRPAIKMNTNSHMRFYGFAVRDRLRLFSLLAVFKRGATAQRGNGSR